MRFLLLILLMVLLLRKFESKGKIKTTIKEGPVVLNLTPVPSKSTRSGGIL